MDVEDSSIDCHIDYSDLLEGDEVGLTCVFEDSQEHVQAICKGKGSVTCVPPQVSLRVLSLSLL